MLEADTGATASVQEPAPVVDGVQGNAPGNDVGSGTDTPALPGYVKGQLDKETSEALLAEIKADPELAKRLPKDPTDIFKQWRTLDKASKSALAIPAKDAPKEVWDQFYKGLGRPESAEGYTLEKPQIPAGMRYDEGREKWFRGLAHAAGLNNAQAKGIFDAWNNQEAATFQKSIEARKVEAKAALDALHAEWQDKFPDNWARMQDAMVQFIPGGKESPLFKKITQWHLDNDPDFLRMMKAIGDKIGPSKFVAPRGDRGGSSGKSEWTFGGIKTS
jgi:hypothetical protein